MLHFNMLNVCTVFWSESLMGRDHSEDLDIDGKVILEWRK